MPAFEDSREWRFGRWAELTVAELLIALGHLVTDTSSLPPENGHGPRVHGQGGLLVPADLDVTLRPWAFRVLLQVKAKGNQGDPTRVLKGEPCHGFGWRDWLRYREAENHLGAPVFVVIVEAPGWQPDFVPPYTVLAQRVSELVVRGDCPTVNRGQEMAYFPRSQFAEDWISRLERCAEHSTAIAARRQRRTSLFEVPNVPPFAEPGGLKR